jgi:hypothetical protein
VQDGVITRLIGKWLKAGVWEKGEVSYPEEGTPQGGVICQRPRAALRAKAPPFGYLAPLDSPLLSNIYLHEVLDKWFVESVQPACQGRTFMVRYADDFDSLPPPFPLALRVLLRRICLAPLGCHGLRAIGGRAKSPAGDRKAIRPPRRRRGIEAVGGWASLRLEDQRSENAAGALPAPAARRRRSGEQTGDVRPIRQAQGFQLPRLHPLLGGKSRQGHNARPFSGRHLSRTPPPRW